MSFNFKWVPTGFGNVKVRGTVHVVTKAGQEITGIKVADDKMLITSKGRLAFCHRTDHRRMVYADAYDLRN